MVTLILTNFNSNSKAPSTVGGITKQRKPGTAKKMNRKQNRGLQSANGVYECILSSATAACSFRQIKALLFYATLQKHISDLLSQYCLHLSKIL